MTRQILQNGQNLLVTLCTLIVERVIWVMMVAMMDLILEVEELSNLLENLTIKIFNKYAHNNYWLDEEVNFVNSPDLLISDGKYALVSAAYFWTIERPKPKKYRLYEIADESKADSDNSDIVERITAVINPQKLSLEQRKEAYKRIKTANVFKIFQ